MENLTYNQISIVLGSWEKIRLIPNYQVVVGTTLYQKLFTRDIESKVLFGWPKDINTSSPELLYSKRFITQSRSYCTVLESALGMLGPESTMMTEILHELGERHYRHYGVGSHLYPIMGDCVMEALEKFLGDDFTPDVRQAWKCLWGEWTNGMTHGEQEYLKKAVATQGKSQQIYTANE